MTYLSSTFDPIGPYQKRNIGVFVEHSKIENANLPTEHSEHGAIYEGINVIAYTVFKQWKQSKKCKHRKEAVLAVTEV